MLACLIELVNRLRLVSTTKGRWIAVHSQTAKILDEMRKEIQVVSASVRKGCKIEHNQLHISEATANRFAPVSKVFSGVRRNPKAKLRVALKQPLIMAVSIEILVFDASALRYETLCAGLLAFRNSKALYHDCVRVSL
jgi:hypothetical protein